MCGECTVENQGPALQLWLEVLPGPPGEGRGVRPVGDPRHHCLGKRMVAGTGGACGRNRGGIHGAPGAGEGTGEQGVLLMGILFAEETRATRPGGWEGRASGSLSPPRLSAVWD